MEASTRHGLSQRPALNRSAASEIALQCPQLNSASTALTVRHIPGGAPPGREATCSRTYRWCRYSVTHLCTSVTPALSWLTRTTRTSALNPRTLRSLPSDRIGPRSACEREVLGLLVAGAPGKGHRLAARRRPLHDLHLRRPPQGQARCALGRPPRRPRRAPRARAPQPAPLAADPSPCAGADPHHASLAALPSSRAAVPSAR